MLAMYDGAVVPWDLFSFFSIFLSKYLLHFLLYLYLEE